MIMSKEEFLKKNEDENYAPGWDVINDEFCRLYPGMQEDHYATTLLSRAFCGGDEYLDGFSVYRNPNGYFHIVTFGMSELYAVESAFGGKYSGWGYEMTIRLKENSPSDCIWAMDMMSNLARYTNKTGKYFKSGDFIIGDGSPIHIGTNSLITSLIVINDVSARTRDTVYGKLEFLQLVGITWKEVHLIKKDIDNFEKLIELMKINNPEFVTDMNRTESYL